MLASRLFLERRRASNVSFKRESMHAFGVIVLDASCDVWWMGGMVMGNGDGFFHWKRGGIRGGGPSISVVLAEFA